MEPKSFAKYISKYNSSFSIGSKSSIQAGMTTRKKIYQIPLKKAASELSLTVERYLEILEYLNLNTIVPPDNKRDEFVLFDYHQAVINSFRENLALESSHSVANEDKNLNLAIKEFEKQFKLEDKYKKAFHKRQYNQKYFQNEFTIKINKVVEDVKIWFDSRKVILDGKTIVLLSMWRYFSYQVDENFHFPTLRKRKNSIYIDYQCFEEVNVAGKIITKLKRQQYQYALNHLHHDYLFYHCIRIMLFLINKISIGYYKPYHRKGLSNLQFKVLLNQSPSNWLLFPTLFGSLEYFKELGIIKEDRYISLKSNVNMMVRWKFNIPRNKRVNLDNLDLTLNSFLDFNYETFPSFRDFLLNSNNPRGKKEGRNESVTNRNICSGLCWIYNQILDRKRELMTYHVNPFLKHGFKKAKKNYKRHKYYTMEELKLIKKKIIGKKKFMLLSYIYFMFYSGCRSKETHQIRVCDINYEEEIIEIPDETGKTGPRHVPMNPELIEILKKWIGNHNNPDFYLFTIYDRPGVTPLSKNVISRQLRKIINEIPSLTMYHNVYSLRHTFAYNYMEAENPEKNEHEKLLHLMNYLGHANTEQTEEYLRGFRRRLAKKEKFIGYPSMLKL